MNKNILNAVIVGSLAMGLASCDENSWNDHYLNGFEGGVDYNNKETGSYTVSDADYAAIAKMLEGEAADDAEKAAAKAIAANLYFDKSGIYPADVVLPLFFDTSSFPYYLASNGSAVDVTYREAGAVPAEITNIGAAKSLSVGKAQYKAAWGGDIDFDQAYPENFNPAKDMLDVLSDGYSNPGEGDYAVVNYNVVVGTPDFNSGKLFLEEPFAEGQGQFTIDNILLPEGSTYVWKFDDRGYMKASAYVNKADRASDAWLISPEIDLPADANAYLTFDQAWNFFKDAATAAKENTVAVREVGGEWNNLTPEAVPESLSWTFVNSGKIDLKAYNGKKIQIGFRYTSTAEKSGTTEIRNVKIASGADIPMVTNHALYCFDGSDWVVPANACMLQPADYEDMGFKNDKLENPQAYIPAYLKQKFPYAQQGAQKYVVYNGKTVSLFVFDGAVWTLNDNGLKTVTGHFEKQNGKWVFIKYVGEAIFDEFNEEVIKLDKSYILVSENICMKPLDSGKSYGYMNTTGVSISDGQIILPGDANAFAFVSTFVKDDVKYEAPEGKFMILGSDGRYIYMQGTYDSFNVKNEPAIADGGAIADGYLWTAKRNADGTWAIVNCFSEKTIAYSTKFTSFGAYETIGEGQLTPYLYIMQ
ncbi:choice-of-anchor J domain-containing protein, partial [Duncaniella freteri]|uniref:choice-of-anchor J domain-containing protein n=2 Tax=Duncaniella TaxID=2518495 RepID=UPI00257683B9